MSPLRVRVRWWTLGSWPTVAQRCVCVRVRVCVCFRICVGVGLLCCASAVQARAGQWTTGIHPTMRTAPAPMHSRVCSPRRVEWQVHSRQDSHADTLGGRLAIRGHSAPKPWSQQRRLGDASLKPETRPPAQRGSPEQRWPPRPPHLPLGWEAPRQLTTERAPRQSCLSVPAAGSVPSMTWCQATLPSESPTARRRPRQPRLTTARGGPATQALCPAPA